MDYPKPPLRLIKTIQPLPKIQADIKGIVKEIDLISYTHNIINRYNLTKDQCNGLSKWVLSMEDIK